MILGDRKLKQDSNKKIRYCRRCANEINNGNYFYCSECHHQLSDSLSDDILYDSSIVDDSKWKKKMSKIAKDKGVEPIMEVNKDSTLQKDRKEAKKDVVKEYIGEERICVYCGNPFNLRHPNAKRRQHCYDQACEAKQKAHNKAVNLAKGREMWRKKYREKNAKKKQCIHCGGMFITKEHATNRVHCYDDKCITYHAEWLKLPKDKKGDKIKIMSDKPITIVDKSITEVEPSRFADTGNTAINSKSIEIAEKPKVDLEQYGHPAIKAHFDRLLDIHRKKDHDYAGSKPLSNFRRSEEFGIEAWRGALIRMADKWSRLCSLAKDEAMVEGESIDDTLDDLAIYSMIVRTLREETDNAENI